MALADKSDAEFDTFLAALTFTTLAEKKTEFETVQTTINSEVTVHDAKRAQLRKHKKKVLEMLKDLETLQAHTDARFADFESRIAALEVS